jgi:hypothetical protein
MTKRSRIRSYYREHRTAGIPFVQAHRLAKLRARDYTSWADIERILGPGETVQYCECCGPEAVRFRLGKLIVDLSYIDKQVMSYWTEESK